RRKERLCPEETEQGQWAKVAVQVAVWVEDKGKVEAEWAAPLPQGRAEVAFARAVERRPLTWSVNPVIKRYVLNVVRQ
ncbi:unnamed protein product, partial [marine sediment metagenome]